MTIVTNVICVARQIYQRHSYINSNEAYHAIRYVFTVCVNARFSSAFTRIIKRAKSTGLIPGFKPYDFDSLRLGVSTMSECDIYTFDGIEYNDDIISFNDIEVVDDTVCGCMATIIKDDTYVMGRIESYPYDGDENMNHVPIVTVVDYNGSIIAEPHIRDSTNMKTAYKNLINGIETAYQEYCVDN